MNKQDKKKRGATVKEAHEMGGVGNVSDKPFKALDTTAKRKKIQEHPKKTVMKKPQTEQSDTCLGK